MFEKILRIFKKRKREKSKAGKESDKKKLKERIEEMIKSGMDINEVLGALFLEEITYTSLLTVSLATVLIKKKIVKEEDLNEEMRKIFEESEKETKWVRKLIEKVKEEEKLDYFG